MFQLILGVIALTVVAAITAATVFYGGDSFTDSASKAEYLKHKNASVQIEAALKIKQATTSDGISTATVDSLVSDGILKSRPIGESVNWAISNGLILKELTDEESCMIVNSGAPNGKKVCHVCGTIDDTNDNLPACNCTGSSASYCTP